MVLQYSGMFYSHEMSSLGVDVQWSSKSILKWRYARDREERGVRCPLHQWKGWLEMHTENRTLLLWGGEEDSLSTVNLFCMILYIYKIIFFYQKHVLPFSNFKNKSKLHVYVINPQRTNSNLSKPGVGKPRPENQIWPVTCFGTACRLRMIFTFFKGL